MPLNSGAHFYTTNGATFYAVGCNDTGSSTPGNNQDYDWGYALLPAAALTPVVIVGWAPGSDFTSGAPANGSPVWVTPTKATTIYVNYSGNYNTGPLIAPNGHHYDTNYALVAYQFQTIYNATTKNMTGARIFTVDGTTFAAAWGEDPSTAGTGLPYMDAGTGIIPFPQPVMTKTSAAGGGPERRRQGGLGRHAGIHGSRAKRRDAGAGQCAGAGCVAEHRNLRHQQHDSQWRRRGRQPGAAGADRFPAGRVRAGAAANPGGRLFGREIPRGHQRGRHERLECGHGFDGQRPGYQLGVSDRLRAPCCWRSPMPPATRSPPT